MWHADRSACSSACSLACQVHMTPALHYRFHLPFPTALWWPGPVPPRPAHCMQLKWVRLRSSAKNVSTDSVSACDIRPSHALSPTIADTHTTCADKHSPTLSAWCKWHMVHTRDPQLLTMVPRMCCKLQFVRLAICLIVVCRASHIVAQQLQ